MSHIKILILKKTVPTSLHYGADSLSKKPELDHLPSFCVQEAVAGMFVVGLQADDTQ